MALAYRSAILQDKDPQFQLAEGENTMPTLNEVKEKRRELSEIEREYLQEHSPCNNESCTFFKQTASGHCTWSILLEECRDYVDEE
jgi:hypothetical protein